MQQYSTRTNWLYTATMTAICVCKSCLFVLNALNQLKTRVESLSEPRLAVSYTPGDGETSKEQSRQPSY